MKNLQVLKKDLQKTRDNIKALQAKQKELDNIDARRAALDEKDFDKYVALKEENAANEAEYIATCEAEYIEKIVAAYIRDNIKIALYHETITVIKEVLKKYDGKPYGEKTKEKIRNEIKAATGCSVWFGKNEINIYELNKEGYTSPACFEVRATTPYDNPLITDENRINAGALDKVHIYQTYTENPRKAARELIKKHRAAYVAAEKLNALLSDLYNAAPDQIKNGGHITSYISNPLYHNITI